MRHKSFLWPDHIIGKGESRRIREEHNAAINDMSELLEALRETLAWMEDCLMDRGHPELPSRRAYDIVRNAVAKATGE